MSLQIPVQKDIGEYEEKVVGKMSFRTLVCVTGGFISAVGAAMVFYFLFGVAVSDATFPVMLASLPFWLAGFWRPYGMKLEEFLPLFVGHFVKDHVILYESTTNSSCLHSTCPTPGTPKKSDKRIVKRKGAELYEPTKKQL